MINLSKPLLGLSEYNDLLNSLRSYSTPINLNGLADSQKVHVVYSVCRHLESRGIFITYNEMQARKAHEDFSFFLGEDAVFFPSREIMLHDIEAKSYDDVFERIKALSRIVNKEYKIVVTSVEAIIQKLISRDLFQNNILMLEQGVRIDLSDFTQKMISMGYERVGTVEGKGQFSIRGGIIDVFSVDSDYAVRMELFDDEIDSIRRFDIVTQRSIDRLASTCILPAREVTYSPKKRQEIIGKIKKDLDEQLKRLSKKDAGLRKHLKERIESDIEKLDSSYYFPGIDRILPYIIDQPGDIMDYAHDALVFVDEPSRMQQRIENVLMEFQESCKTLLEKGNILPSVLEMHYDYADIEKKLDACTTVYLQTIPTERSGYEKCKRYSFSAKQITSYHGKMDLLVKDILQWKQAGSRIIVLSGTRGKGERLLETLETSGVHAFYSEEPDIDLIPGQVMVTRGSLNKGFEYPSIGLVVVSDKEIFGQDRKLRKPRRHKDGDRIRTFTDLKIGDYVVHQTHGIGQYVGIEKLVVENVKKDYLKIRYQDGDFLYIPTNQLDLIQKYIGTEGKTPRLSRLGGTDWARTKKKVKESLRKLAEDLVKLYAQRQSVKGYAFSKDTVWQKQFEEMFPYEETEDQLKCIEEIKRDMESDKVMDRLLCGDVGYGKTEVAIRAVFKAVMDGKQVAFLVPTTILAQQHYTNFRERMKDFPITVDVLSRFRSPSEQKRIIKDLKSGKIDVLIGTHRMLQKDVEFKNLGLLVIDEEQRFGVAHKERLKTLKTNVDVLTLTATPIPRTLHMSLVGIRDISIIEDPPEERYPVQTYVMEYNPDVIRDAIIRELGRKGQVFYLFNRVRSIHLKASQIQKMIPEARIAVAHGQMEESELENVMLDFINGDYDILVCTTIIESGLDMPNVNTIIVEDADRLGLAQLYQLRGRVGRSNRQAYAYITYKKDKVLQETAEKRLQAIKEFTEFGSGFKIAMRDLEIRGAGNLLGPEQHGHMDSVGYEMYCRLLEEAIKEVKGEVTSEYDNEISIDIKVDAYIDDDYIEDEEQKIEMYKRIASIRDENDVLDVQDELIDRYGDIPGPVSNLISIAYIKALARDAGFSSVSQKGGSVILQCRNEKSLNLEVISRLSSKYKGQILFNAGASPYLVYKTNQADGEKLLDNIKILLQDIKSFAV